MTRILLSFARKLKNSPRGRSCAWIRACVSLDFFKQEVKALGIILGGSMGFSRVMIKLILQCVTTPFLLLIEEEVSRFKAGRGLKVETERSLSSILFILVMQNMS